MRLRTDDWWAAGRKRAIALGARQHPQVELPNGNWYQPYLDQLESDELEAAQPGDVWRIHWHRPDDEVGPVAGYALTCPAENCDEGVHPWTTARNCSQRTDDRCPHEGEGSCWTWTGSPEDGTLSASPSLFASGAPCKWHGFLIAGMMSGA